jgi:hypothetical protein
MAVSDQCYFNGEFYQATQATAAGQSPATAPGKWSRVQIPARWRWLLSRLTYAHMLELDGQTEKSSVHRNVGMNDERRGLVSVTRVEANREGFLERPSVRQRSQV